ncbi:MAG: hypothetical protein OXF25_01040 [Cyanobacteria bacterium MAG CAR3_bin_5]|nr:hypothetical protein [Cyanobacteria bacterium MAG CAR3_bin_5]
MLPYQTMLVNRQGQGEHQGIKTVTYEDAIAVAVRLTGGLQEVNQTVIAHIMAIGATVVAADIDSGYSTVGRISYGRIDFQVLEVRIG